MWNCLGGGIVTVVWNCLGGREDGGVELFRRTVVWNYLGGGIV